LFVLSTPIGDFSPSREPVSLNYNELKANLLFKKFKSNRMKKLATAILLWLTVHSAYAAERSNTRDALKDTVNWDFKRVIVKGNTTVYFIQGNRDEITIDEGNPEDIRITQLGSRLRIQSENKNPVIVTVYFRDLYRIEASGSAVVRSQYALNLRNLQIMLKDDAAGDVIVNTNSLYTETNDQSKLVLRGKTGRHIIEGYSNLTTKKFTAIRTEEKNDTGLIARWERD
jgi:hypothetical protein